MTAGGQCCLAWLLPAHDAVLLSDLLLPAHLLGMFRHSNMSGQSVATCRMLIKPTHSTNVGS